MLRSLYSGVTGMKAHQVRMDVVGNNIANVNTTGFKSGRVNFSDMLNQTIRGAIAPGEGGAGINPAQVGLGVKIGGIDTLYTQGGLQVTDRVTDLALQGNGFFVITTSVGGEQVEYYTRDGAMSINDEGFLVHTATGYKVLGRDALNQDMEIDIIGSNAVTFSVDRDGVITGVDADGNKIDIGTLKIASFTNLEGLYKLGGNLYQKSVTSGAPLFNTGDATVESGYLEMSNVDLTAEFTNMIITQRGFQANSRVITTSDSMLEELLALKR